MDGRKLPPHEGSQFKVFRQPEGNSYLKEFNFRKRIIVPLAFLDIEVVCEEILGN